MSYSRWPSAAAAGLIATWFGAAAPAEAGTVVVPASITFVATGTVMTGSDPGDLFGGGDLSGLPYVATYIFQTTPSTSPPYYCCAATITGAGGTVSSLTPATLSTVNVSATITVNGDTFALSGVGSVSNFAANPLGGEPSHDQRAMEMSGESSGGILAGLGSSVLRTPSLWLGVPGATDIFQSNTVSGVTGFGASSEFVAYVAPTDQILTEASLNVLSISSGDITTMEVSVPEPSTWAMMLAGFAGLGFARFRTSRRMVPAAS
jgi:PEP-CTERM motif